MKRNRKNLEYKPLVVPEKLKNLIYEYGIIKDIMGSQLSEMTKSEEVYNIHNLKIENLKNRIETIINSKRIEHQSFEGFTSFKVHNDSTIINIPDFCLNVLIPQTLINIKKYAKQEIDSVRITATIENKNVNLLFLNRIWIEKVNFYFDKSEKKGIELNNNLVRNFNNKNANKIYYNNKHFKSHNIFATLIKFNYE